MSANPTRSLTSLLRSPQAAEAAAALADQGGPGVVEGLADVLWQDASAEAAVAAARALGGRPEPLAREALCDGLRHPKSSVRRASIRALNPPFSAEESDALLGVLRQDPRWSARTEAARRLLSLPPAAATLALSDPHWRVRNVAARALARGDLGGVSAGSDPRSQGALAYARFLQGGALPAPPAPAPVPEVSWWDPDPAVVRRELLALPRAERRAALALAPLLLISEDARLRQIAGDDLWQRGDIDTLVAAYARLEEPREPFLAEELARVTGLLDADRLEEVVRRLLSEGRSGARAWALDQLGTSLPGPLAELLPAMQGALADPVPAVRRAAVEALQRLSPSAEDLRGALHDEEPMVLSAALRALAGRVPDLRRHPSVQVRRAWVEALLADRSQDVAFLRSDPDARIRQRLVEAGRVPPEEAQRDPDHRVRAAAMTPARAAALWADPEQEPSWRVLAAAALHLERPLSEIAPPPVEIPRPPPPARQRQVAPAEVPRRPLWSTGLSVSPLGLSGHYGLDAAGFEEGLEAGVNLLFWEKSYGAQTRFLAGLPAARRSELVVLTGSYDADPRQVRRDLEGALRQLRLDRIGIFLVFWVRSWRRLAGGVQEVLADAHRAGKVATWGVSTHDRGLARQAIEAGWPVVIVRHSAAHRGVEEEVLPAARAAGTGVITFSALCYGRLLDGQLSPADAYRYSMAQPGVAATLSAPGDIAQLRENLDALREPELRAERRAALLARGQVLHQEQRAFLHALRWR